MIYPYGKYFTPYYIHNWHCKVFCWLLTFLILSSMMVIHLHPFQKFWVAYYLLWHSWGSRLPFSGFFFFRVLTALSAFFPPENWTTRAILICAFSLFAQHLKQFPSGQSTLRSLEGHSSKTARKWLFPDTLFWSSSIRIAPVLNSCSFWRLSTVRYSKPWFDLFPFWAA